MAGCSGTPLARKLGIAEGATVALLGAPAGFGELLDGLPAGVTFRTRAQGHLDLVISFQDPGRAGTPPADGARPHAATASVAVVARRSRQSSALRISAASQ